MKLPELMMILITVTVLVTRIVEIVIIVITIVVTIVIAIVIMILILSQSKDYRKIRFFAFATGLLDQGPGCAASSQVWRSPWNGKSSFGILLDS